MQILTAIVFDVTANYEQQRKCYAGKYLRTMIKCTLPVKEERKIMTYASGTEFVKDFVTRTRENYAWVKKGPYEVTQLINSAIGLLFIPKENMCITDDLVDAALLKQMTACVNTNTYPGTLNLYQLIKHLRNGIAHDRMEFHPVKPNIKDRPLKNEYIIIRDKDKDNNYEFEIELTIDILEKFFIEFSDGVIKYFDNNKTGE